MEFLGYVASIFIGISLGLIGGGGSILTVPVLVYLFAINATLATTYSLFVVGVVSMVGSVTYLKQGLVNIKTAVVFGLPSIVSVFLTRTFIVQAIPVEVFSLGSFIVTKDLLLMLLFAVLMVLAAYKMIKKGKVNHDEALGLSQNYNYPLVFLQGLMVGLITGLIGAGGGFLIIPALVNLLKLKMKEAIGTSLLIIAANSMTGFLFSFAHSRIEWSFLLSVTLIAMVGILVGSYISKRIDGAKLKPAFGWFVMVMGIYIIVKETILK